MFGGRSLQKVCLLIDVDIFGFGLDFDEKEERKDDEFYTRKIVLENGAVFKVLDRIRFRKIIDRYKNITLQQPTYRVGTVINPEDGSGSITDYMKFELSYFEYKSNIDTIERTNKIFFIDKSIIGRFNSVNPLKDFSKERHSFLFF